jgi:hypothetical protein
VEWGIWERAYVDRHGNPQIDRIARIDIIASADVDPSACCAISAIIEGRHGLRIKLHDKLAALRLLGLELGMFKEKAEIDADSSLRAIVEAVH